MEPVRVRLIQFMRSRVREVVTPTSHAVLQQPALVRVQEYQQRPVVSAAQLSTVP